MTLRRNSKLKSGAPHITLLCLLTLFLWITTAAAQPIETISPLSAAKLIQIEKDNPDFVILDIRTPPEFQQVRLQKAVLLDFYSNTFADDLKQLDKNKIYLVYCRSGNRSGKALALFSRLEFTRVYNMADGINGWIRAGLPVIG